MKKIISLFLVMIFCFSLVACGSDSARESGEKKEDVVKFQLKDTVSTDIVDFTLEDSKFTYYVSNVSSNYVEPTEEANTLFASRKGTCYVSMTVTVSNTDRGGSLSFAGGFGSWNPADWKVKYNGETYEMFGFDLNSTNVKTINLSYGALVDKETGKVIQKVGSNNKLISAGETYSIRMFGIIEMEPESLDDGFELEVYVPNSAGEYETFVYEVPARS